MGISGLKAIGIQPTQVKKSRVRRRKHPREGLSSSDIISSTSNQTYEDESNGHRHGFAIRFKSNAPIRMYSAHYRTLNDSINAFTATQESLSEADKILRSFIPALEDPPEMEELRELAQSHVSRFNEVFERIPGTTREHIEGYFERYESLRTGQVSPSFPQFEFEDEREIPFARELSSQAQQGIRESSNHIDQVLEELADRTSELPDLKHDFYAGGSRLLDEAAADEAVAELRSLILSSGGNAVDVQANQEPAMAVDLLG